MERFLGIDGFSRGWVAAWIDGDGNQGFDYSSNLERLLNYPHTSAMIDIPIGHTHQLDRHDLFQFPIAAIATDREFENQAQANEYYRENNEPGISSQLWCLRCKIREVDKLITPERQRVLRETHPEPIFWNIE